MIKRFRDNAGHLTMSIAEVKAATKKEASKYYKPGNIYLNNADNKEYVYLIPTKRDGELAHFKSFDGYELFIPIENLGTFLPDVSNPGFELIAVIE